MINQENMTQLWTSVLVDDLRMQSWDLEEIDDTAKALNLTARSALVQDLMAKYGQLDALVIAVGETNEVAFVGDPLRCTDFKGMVRLDSSAFREAFENELRILGQSVNEYIRSEDLYTLLLTDYFGLLYYYNSAQGDLDNAISLIERVASSPIDLLQGPMYFFPILTTMWFTNYKGFKGAVRTLFPAYLKRSIEEMREQHIRDRKEAMKSFGTGNYRSPAQREAERNKNPLLKYF